MAQQEKPNYPFKRNVRLNTPSGVQRLLGRVTNLLLQNKIATDKARATAYLATVLLKSFETVDMEQRLTEIENQLKGGEKE